MNVLLTGATGFLGRHVHRALLDAGHRVTVCGRREPELACTFHAVDLLQIGADHLAGHGAVCNLAAAGVSPQPVDWDTAFAVNTHAVLRLAQLAAAAGVPRFIQAGTCMEYGRGAERYQAVPADAALEPICPYAASKAAASLGLLALAHGGGIGLVLLRPFHLWGEGQFEGNLYPQLLGAAQAGEDFAMTAGTQVRDFYAVDRAALDFVRALRVPVDRPVVRNLGSGVPVQVREFAAERWRALGARGKLLAGALPGRPGEVKRFVPELTPWP
ncbi:MAG: NAD(P)-dependent oxidoreductase [Planctomycetota bacterium]